MPPFLTRRRVALLWLLLVTGCAPLQPVPTPPTQPAPQASAAVCTAWTGAVMAWPIFSQLIAAQLEHQRANACVLPPGELAPLEK